MKGQASFAVVASGRRVLRSDLVQMQPLADRHQVIRTIIRRLLNESPGFRPFQNLATFG